MPPLSFCYQYNPHPGRCKEKPRYKAKKIAVPRSVDNFHRPPVAKILPFCYNKVVNKGKESGNHGPRTADMDAKEIGRTISTHRKALGLTQMQLAAQLQVSNRTVSKWENGDGFPDISLLPGLAAALDITIDELLTGEVPAQIQQSVSAAEARRAQGRYQVAKIVAGALLVAGSVIGLITEVRLFWVKPFYMFIEIYLLVLAFVLVVVGAMVFLIGLVRYRTEMQHLNTANRIEALAALAGAGLFPLFTVLRFLHAYTRPGMAVFIVLLAVAVGLWVWRLAVDCKKLQAEKSHPIAEKD